ncbi:long-chain fatty acid--CoA ligase [Oligoflexia bacterium]|nr:long-chain fatty acid--CoA ligase [Oligoflexia bacterium]
MRRSLDEFPSIPAVFFDIAEEYPDRIVYSQAQIGPDDDLNVPRLWSSTTYSEVKEQVKKVGHLLKALGMAPGARAAIISNSRPEWMIADMGVLAVGGVVASVYQSLPMEDIGYILFDSGSEIVFAENQEQVDKLLELLSNPILIPETEERSELQAQIGLSKIIAFDQVDEHPLVIQFEDIVAGDQASELDTYSSLKRDDMAALVYTSGTTGPPKGVMQTHGNHLANVRQVVDSGLVVDDSSLLLFLPLAHSFAKLMGYLGFLLPANLKFTAVADRKSSKIHPESTTKDISEAGATIVPVVPRLLEKMQAAVSQKRLEPGLLGKIFRLTLWSAAEIYKAEAEGRSGSILAQIAFGGTSAIRAKVKKKLFGSNYLFAVSGGAKLNRDVAEFFESLGIEILEGYGLTETCVATNVNLHGSNKVGTVGPVLSADVELRLNDDGEILLRGPNVAVGYYNREAATKAAWDAEGWFHTGDLGALDSDQYLSIIGRKKEILVTSYGKNIAPEEIEGKIKQSHYISQVLLIGDARPYCVALVGLDLGAVENWAKKLGVDAPADQLYRDQRVFNLIWSEVKTINEHIAQHAAPKRIAILPEEATIDNGLLTPTFKIKRKVMEEQYQELIDNLYGTE